MSAQGTPLFLKFPHTHIQTIELVKTRSYYNEENIPLSSHV